MGRKILFALAALIAGTQVAFADTLPYLGVEVGGDWGNLQLKDAAGVNTNFSYNGAVGGLFAGLGDNIGENTYLALEGFAYGNSGRTSTKTIITQDGPSSAQIKMRYSYGASILPGYLFTQETMIYLRLGVIRSRYDLNQSVVPSSASSNTSDNNATGAEFGIGGQTCFYHDWAVRAEYDYSDFRSYNAFGNRIIPRDQQVKVGVLYRFE